jgi:hypothetical protein
LQNLEVVHNASDVDRQGGFLCADITNKNGELWMIVGYARVSTDGQTLDSQQAALRAAGADKVFAEKISGAVTDRKALSKAIAELNAGDVRVVTRLDRSIADERELIRARTDDGRKRAQARGVKFGRKPKLSQFQIAEAIARRRAGEALIDIGRSYNVSHSTISRLAGSRGIKMTDDRSTVVLFLPHEFVAMCEADDVSPIKVLNGFVADLCGLDGSHGSDARDLAQRYYDRCYPYRK